MRWLTLSLLALCCACWGEDEEPPGEYVGSFEALGLMVEHSCGAAIPASDPLNVRFDLRSESNGRAYWLEGGGTLFAGVESDGTYTFQVSRSWMVIEPDRYRGFVGCSVTQRDVFTIEIEEAQLEATEDGGVEEPGADAGTEESDGPSLMTLSGSQVTTIDPLTGSNCTPAVAASGGPFLSLPCRIEYVLTGDGLALE